MLSKIKVGIYMPSFGRPKLALEALRNLNNQIENMSEWHKDRFSFEVIISVNSDKNYSEVEFKPYCSKFIQREINFGGNINIALGFSSAINENWDYLWIIGDDEPIGNDVITVIVNALLDSKPDLIVGSKLAKGFLDCPNSLMQFNAQVGGTLTFISSTVYKVNFESVDVTNVLEFQFTSYPHLCLLNTLIIKKKLQSVRAIEMQDLCDYHYKVLVDPLKPRAQYETRDSIVFFGKIVAALSTKDESYIRSELLSWWRDNWHRFSMYRDSYDFRGFLLLGWSLKYFSLWKYVLLAQFPYWRIKEILRPVPKSRVFLTD